MHALRSEDNFVKSVLSCCFYVGSRDHTQLPDLCSECLYPLRHLVSPAFGVFSIQACIYFRFKYFLYLEVV